MNTEQPGETDTMTRATPQKSQLVTICSVVAMLLAGCTSSQLSTDQWRDDWQALLDEIPPLEVLVSADPDSLRVICDGALGNLRTAVVDMENAPSQHIEDAALNYLEFAETVFFECPIHRGDYSGFEEAYEEMHRLAAAVGALIAPEEP
jgi:hypothetical protein